MLIMLRLKNDFKGLLSNFCNYNRSFSLTRSLTDTYYEALNVEKNSTQDEIRTAYLKLCKENHPDRDKGDSSLHKKFLHISEAYKVLSKPESRLRYDQAIASLEYSKTIRKDMYRNNYDINEYTRGFNDPAFYHNRKEEFKGAKDEPDNFYGIKGVKRLPNATVFILLLALTLFSGFINIIIIKNSRLTHQNERISQENAKILDHVKKLAASRTIEENIEELEKSYHENLEKMGLNSHKTE